MSRLKTVVLPVDAREAFIRRMVTKLGPLTPDERQRFATILFGQSS